MKTMLHDLKEMLFGVADEAALPARVKELIRRAQEESEILIGWVQLAGVVFFALVYAIALVVASVGITRLTHPPVPHPGISDDSGALIPTVLMLVADGVAGVSVRKIWKSARRRIHRDWRTHPAQNKGDRSS